MQAKDKLSQYPKTPGEKGEGKRKNKKDTLAMDRHRRTEAN